MKITSKLVFYHENNRVGEARVRSGEVIFSGPEDIARKLAEQLKSSEAQRGADERAVYERNLKRKVDFVKAAFVAKSSRSTDTGGETQDTPRGSPKEDSPQ